MKERKPLFPEYIWMFFVGLLLAIIVCMRLLPGHAETVNPVYGNPNVFTWESLQNPSSVFQAPFNTSGWINSDGNIFLDASVYRSNDSGASFYGPMIDYEYVALQNPIIYGQIGATYSGTDLITVSSNNNNGPVPVEAIPSSYYYRFFEHGYSYFACDLWCFPWGWWTLEPVHIGYAIVKMTSGSVPSVYKITGLANYQLFQVELDDANVVDIIYYWNSNIDNVDIGLDAGIQNQWIDFSGGLEGIDPDFIFTNPELNEECKLFISTVYMGNFNFQHTGDWNEQYTKNYKYRITVDSRYFQVKSAPSPTPTPEPEIQSIICKDTSGYYFMFDFYVSDFGSSISLDVNDNNALTSAMSTYNLSNTWVNPASWQMYWSGSGSYRSHLFVYFSGSVSEIYMYQIGSSLVSSDFSYIRNNFEGSLVSDSTSNVFFGSSEGLFGFDFAPYKGFYSPYSTELIASSFSYKTRDYVSEGQNFPSNYLFSKTNIGLNFPLYCAYTLGLEGSSGETAGPSPTATPTITPTPVSVQVILPSSTPGPTAPVSFSGSDLPGGGAGGIDGISGNAGSISTNGGASPSTANGVYNYWSTVLSQNQALAFIASFFQILPFDLVYALGSLIFILILIAMARLFIHFIE